MLSLFSLSSSSYYRIVLAARLASSIFLPVGLRPLSCLQAIFNLPVQYCCTYGTTYCRVHSLPGTDPVVVVFSFQRFNTVLEYIYTVLLLRAFDFSTTTKYFAQTTLASFSFPHSHYSWCFNKKTCGTWHNTVPQHHHQSPITNQSIYPAITIKWLIKKCLCTMKSAIS